MADARNGDPARRTGEESALFGVVGFRPGFVAVLIFLTLTVGLVAYRISRDAVPRHVEALVMDALRMFAPPPPGSAPSPPADPGMIEGKVREWTGVALSLPRDEGLFSFQGIAKVRMDRQAAAALRLTFEDEPFLLVVMRKTAAPGSAGAAGIFAGRSFLSGEAEGKSYVYWERSGGRFFLVSDADLTRTFDLVRRYFASAGGE